MRYLARCLAFVACLCVSGCCKKPPPRVEKPETVPQTPIALGAEPAWPLGDAPSVERLGKRVAGTTGTFVLPLAPNPKLPVHGALVTWHDGSTSFRFHQPYAAAPVGGDDWFLVLADSGIWLLESETLAVRARVVERAEGDLASSPDGKRFAYGRCEAKACFVDIRTFPGLELVWSTPADVTHRLRFSSDGTMLASASTRRNSATVIDIDNKTSQRLGADNEVNDALVLLADDKWVVYSTDSDVAIIQNWETQEVVYNTGREMLSRSNRGFDQNAVAYDPVKDELLVGGNDDVVWRFAGIKTGAPYYGGRTGFANDVEDIVLLANGDALVGLDCGSIDVWRADQSRSSGIGRSVGLISWGARLSLDSNEAVLAVLGGAVLHWKPAEPLVRQSTFFGPNVDWQKYYTKSDVLLLGRTEAALSYVAQRASLTPTVRVEAATRMLGELHFETHSPEVALLDNGTRLIMGEGNGEMLRVYRLPLGGALSEAENTSIPFNFISTLRRADGKRVGYEGALMAGEIDEKGARVLGKLEDGEGLDWNKDKGAWQACAIGRCRPLGDGPNAH